MSVWYNLNRMVRTMLITDNMAHAQQAQIPVQAIAIVLGPLGSHPYDSTMERYGQYYNNRSCSVILSSSPPIRFLLNRNLQETAREVLYQTAMALRNTPSQNVPVVMHTFSNGGAFLLEAIEKELLSQPPQQAQIHDNHHKADYELIRSRMQIGYQLFDSCPCYIRTIGDTPQYFFDSFPHVQLSKWVRHVYTSCSTLSLTLWCLFTTGSWTRRPQEFWNHMLHSNTICPTQIYIYTTADMLTDASAIDRLIEWKRRSSTLTNRDDKQSRSTYRCTVYRYDDSNHCRFDIDHPMEYQRMIDDALTSIINTNTNNNNTGSNKTNENQFI